MTLEMNKVFTTAVAQHWDIPREAMDIVRAELAEQTNQAHVATEVLAMLALRVGVVFAKAETAAAFLDEVAKISVPP